MDANSLRLTVWFLNTRDGKYWRWALFGHLTSEAYWPAYDGSPVTH